MSLLSASQTAHCENLRRQPGTGENGVGFRPSAALCYRGEPTSQMAAGPTVSVRPGSQAWQEDGNQRGGMSIDPFGVLRVPPCEKANLRCVHVGQRCRADEHVVEDLVVDGCGNAGLAKHLPCRPD